MIRLTREQFETLKRRENPEVFTSEQISNWIIDYSEMLQKAELNELDEFEKAAVDKFNDEFKSFTKVTVIDSPAEDSLQKGLIYTDFYIREPQVKKIQEIIKSEDKEDEIVEKTIFLDTKLNRDLNRVGQELVIEKSMGEGSRGGIIIGHTRSGKPIYDTFNHAAHKDFTHKDHSDAAKLHEKDKDRTHFAAHATEEYKLKRDEDKGKDKKMSKFDEKYESEARKRGGL